MKSASKSASGRPYPSWDDVEPELGDKVIAAVAAAIKSAKVQLHADLTILAQLASALLTART